VHAFDLPTLREELLLWKRESVNEQSLKEAYNALLFTGGKVFCKIQFLQ
jgi:hypothetical protein